MSCWWVDTDAHPGHVCAATWSQVREVLPAGQAHAYEVAVLAMVSATVLALGVSAVVALMAWWTWWREQRRRQRRARERAALLAARRRRAGPRVYPVVCSHDATVVWRRPRGGDDDGDGGAGGDPG